MKKTLFFITLLALASLQSFGQEVKIDAEIRSRAEVRDGFIEPLADSLNAAYVNNLRTKLNLSYKHNEIKAKLSIIDTRTYGGTSTSSTGNGLGVLEAWGEYAFTPELSFALGRQGLEYDDKRLFSYNNWSNTPGAHDLLLLKYTTSGLAVHLGSAYNNAGDSTQFLSPYRQAYKTLNFIWLGKQVGKLSTSAIWVNDSYENGSTGNIDRSYRNTIGGNIGLNDKKSHTTFAVGGYYQFGRDRQDKSLRAFLLSAKVQQQFFGIWSAQIGSDVFSGSKNDIASNKNNTFNKLYGTNHAFNGSIEYWAIPPSQGLIDIYAGVTAKPSSKFNINLTYHHFSTAKEIAPEYGKGIGSEIDITANYIVSSQFAIQGGWSSYFTTEETDILKRKTGVDTRFPQWAYVQLTFMPVFLNKK